LRERAGRVRAYVLRGRLGSSACWSGCYRVRDTGAGCRWKILPRTCYAPLPPGEQAALRRGDTLTLCQALRSLAPCRVAAGTGVLRLLYGACALTPLPAPAEEQWCWAGVQRTRCAPRAAWRVERRPLAHFNAIPPVLRVRPFLHGPPSFAGSLRVAAPSYRRFLPQAAWFCGWTCFPFPACSSSTLCRLSRNGGAQALAHTHHTPGLGGRTRRAHRALRRQTACTAAFLLRLGGCVLVCCGSLVACGWFHFTFTVCWFCRVLRFACVVTVCCLQFTVAGLLVPAPAGRSSGHR